MATSRIVPGRDLRPGDIVDGLAGNHRTLTSVRPYDGSLAPLWDGQARTGEFDGHWRMTIEPSAMFQVVNVTAEEVTP